MGQPRPLRPLERPRLRPPVLAPPPPRVQGLDRGPQEGASKLSQPCAFSARPRAPRADFLHPLLPALQFRQLDSITPGHPELGVTEGIEVTTGPLGQGFANAVGLAIAQAHLGATFNKDNFSLFDNYTYMFTGDGCLMEGVASEAASLAGCVLVSHVLAVALEPLSRLGRASSCSRTSR